MAKKITAKPNKKGEVLQRGKGITEIDVTTSNGKAIMLFNNNISDIENIKVFAPENVLSMDISANKISDISALEKFVNLEILVISHNTEIKDFAVLDKLLKLQTVIINFEVLAEDIILPKNFRKTNCRLLRINNTENDK